MEILELMRNFQKGDHLSYINYESQKSVDYFGAFLAVGIERQEKCIYLRYDTCEDELKASLAKYNVDMDHYLATGQLLILPATEFYFDQDGYSKTKIHAQWSKIAQDSVDYDGFRVLGETGWIKDQSIFEEIIQCVQHTLQAIFGDQLTALCQYRVDNCGVDRISKIFSTYDYVFCDNGNSISLFRANEVLHSEKTIKFLHESIKDRAKLNQTCRNLAFVNNLVSQTLYREGRKVTADQAMSYLTQEYQALVSLYLIIDKETKKVRLVSGSGIDIDRVVSMISQPVLRGLVDYASFARTCITELFPDIVLEELWLQLGIKYLAIIPMHNAPTIMGLAFLGWKQSNLASTANLELINHFLNSVTMALDLHCMQEKTNRRRQDYEKLEALGALTSGIAHEFNNILAVIMGNCQLLDFKARDNDLKKYVSEIAIAAQDAANIVRRIQNYSRPQANYQIKGFAINSIIDSALDFTRTKWVNESVAAGIVVEISTELNSTKHVYGNETEIREVFVNLILNAIDAMPKGGNLVITSEDGDGHVSVTVKDTGVGMSDDEVGKVFDPFFSTKLERGTGLGLTICKNIITAHNGQISVQSEKGKGTIFSIKFPCGKAEENTEDEEISTEISHLKILVVDDDQQVLHSITDQLVTLGHIVEGFTSPLKLLAHLQADQQVDLVLSDLAMPIINGIELAKKIKVINADLPVIIMTGWFDELRNVIDRDLVEGILYKPFSLYQLQKQIVQIMCAYIQV